MRLRLLVVPVLFVAAAFAEVKIEPPSPYMSSPPPAEADTTVIDPGRKPHCETQPGIAEAWYADWNLVTDRPSAGPLDIKGPRRNQPTVRAAFDENGWPTEVVYYDLKGRPRWTKLFKYPSRIPPGPGDVPYTTNWIGPNGKAIQMTKVSEGFKNGNWQVAMKKYEVGDVLGEPLMIEINSVGTTFSANAETWVYFIDGKEVRFSFNKDNHLTALPVVGAVAVAPVKPEPSKPADAKSAPDTSKPKPAESKAVKPTEAKGAIDTSKSKHPEASAPAVDSGSKVVNSKTSKLVPAGKVVSPKASGKAVADTSKKAIEPKVEAAKPVDPSKPVAKPAADTVKPKPVEPAKPKYNSKAKLIVEDTAKPKAK